MLPGLEPAAADLLRSGNQFIRIKAVRNSTLLSGAVMHVKSPAETRFQNSVPGVSWSRIAWMSCWRATRRTAWEVPAEFRRRVLHLAAKGAVSGTTGAANRSAAMPRRRPMSARAIRGGSTSRATERIIWVRPARVGGHPSRAE